MHSRLRCAVAVCCISLLPAALEAQQRVTTIRPRSSVLLRAPDTTSVARAPVKPKAAVSAVRPVVADTQPRRSSPLVVAIQPSVTAGPKAATVTRPPKVRRPPVRITPDTSKRGTAATTDSTKAAPAATADSTKAAVTTPAAAARALATKLYGTKAKLSTVNIVNDRTVSVWVADAPVKEPAPPGSDVQEGVTLPFRYIGVDSVTGDVMALKPWFDDGGGLRYDSRTGTYRATLRIGLRDTLHGAAPRALNPRIRLSVAAAADSVTPEILEVAETNVFVTKASLSTRRISSAMRVTLWPDFSDRGVDLWIPFQPDSVIVRVDRSAIAGFGLGDARVTVELSPGAAAPGDSIAVSLEATNGTFAGGPLVYPKGNAPATVTLRSSGMGMQTISARAGVLIAGSRQLEYTFPTGLLFGGLGGALLGTVMLALRDRKSPAPHALGWLVASGMATGILIAIIAAVGVLKIPGFELPAGGGALVSLLAGALGGYVGPKGVEKLFGAFASGREAPTTAKP